MKQTEGIECAIQVYLAGDCDQNYCKDCEEKARESSLEASHEVDDDHKGGRVEYMCQHVGQRAADIVHTHPVHVSAPLLHKIHFLEGEDVHCPEERRGCPEYADVVH